MTSDSSLCMPKCRGIDIEDKSITQLQNYLVDNVFTSKELTECYLKRIEQVNPYTRSVIEVNPDALEIATALDEERDAGKMRGLLHGIPFLIKDNMATKDKMQTTAGSSMLIGAAVPEDADVVAGLRKAGGVLLGHANLSEWASMRATWYSEGYSSRGGQSRNPYNLAEHPGGSSGGSASSVACNMCAFSLGTETDGSVMFPADRNGVVGIKPTVGLTSQRGIIPESPSFDTVGVLGRTVADAAITLDSIETGENALDGRSKREQRPFASWVGTQEVLKGAKFGLPWSRVWESASNKDKYKSQYEMLETVINSMRNAGAEVIDRTDFPSAEEIIPPDGWDWDYGSKIGHPDQSEFVVVKAEFYKELEKYLSSLTSNPEEIHSLEDVVAYNVKHTEREGGVAGTHPAWPTGQDSLEESMESKGIKDQTYVDALSYVQRKAREEGIDAALGTGLDGLLVPLQADGGVACQVAAKAGYPMITIPIGVAENGVPFGLGIIQSAWKEHLLIKYGSAIENLTTGRSKPSFLNLHAKNCMYVGVPPEETKT